MSDNKVVYFHINPLKNEVFYVGIGSLKRAYDKGSRNRFWKALVSKYGFIVDVVESGLSLEKAKEIEILYIKKIGRRNLNRGTLVNLADGGEGKNGSKESDETKQKKSDYWKKYYEKNSSHNLGKKHTKEVNLKKGKSMGENNTARKIIYKGVEFDCVKSLWKQHFHKVMSYSNFVLSTRGNKINLN